MEKGFGISLEQKTHVIIVSSPNLLVDWPKESCQNDTMKTSQTQLQ